MARFDDVDLGGDKTMKRMMKAEQDKRRAIAKVAAEFGFKSHERGENLEMMLANLEKLIASDEWSTGL